MALTLLRRLTTATAAATLALVAVGGLVRATGSGLGCPDWPRCHGRLVPPLEFHALVEYSHRLTASIVVLLVSITAWAAWRLGGRRPRVRWPAVGAVGVVVLQAALGAVVVRGELKAALVTAHFGVAMLLVTLVVVAATAARERRAALPDDGPFRRLTWWTLALTGALLLAGAYVRGEGAGLAFLDWPLMDGRLVPDLTSGPSVAAFIHRVLAAGVVSLGAALAIRARRLPRVRPLAWAAFALLVTQAALGAAAVLTRLAAPAVAGHVTGSALAWASLVALATIVGRRRSEEGAAPRAPRRAREIAAAYLQLTKPDIIVLLLVTTVPAMVLAARGMPPWPLIGATLLGGALTAGGAGALNSYLDRDIDSVMGRTRGRPIPSRRIEPARALAFGLSLTAAGTLWLAATVNALAAALAAAAAAFYVGVYTMWMKRSTPQNIVIGGAAGAAPALIGWAAAAGTIELPAVVLFAIVFVWTPPHFWALSLNYAGDYRAAGIPMLPVVRGRTETARGILRYSVLLLAASLLLFPSARMGLLYLSAAVGLGAVFIGYAIRILRDTRARAAMSLFHYSITYLGLLFAAAALDQLLRTGARP